MKKVLSLLLVLSMLVGMIAAMSISASAATTITIASVDDWMSKLSGKTVGAADITVTADVLDFAGKTVNPVKDFKGTFDGQGVVIKNLTIETEGETGMFNCLTGAATFKNFAIFDSTFKGKEWVACIVCCTSKDVTVENVYIGETVNVIASKNKNNSYAGGLIGGCTDGVSGQTDPDVTTHLTINNCVFAGTIEAEGQYVGGFVGDAFEAKVITITNSMVLGKVPSDRSSSRGFIGAATDPTDEITMTNCIYAGGNAKEAYNDLPFFNSIDTATVTNCYTISTKSDGKVYNSVTAEDENSGVSVVTLLDLVGQNAVEVDGFAKRDRDIMLPSALVSLFGNDLPSTADKYSSKYTVTWKDEDGTVLATEEYDIGDMPTFKGEEPTKEGDETYKYTFGGWTPDVVAVSGNAEYTAKFVKVRNIVAEEDEETTAKASSTTKPATTTSTTTSATTDAAKDEGGCGSVIGGGILMLALLAGGATVVCKKKED